MRPLRIIQTESSMELGGQEFAVLALTEGLVTRGHFVTLVVQPNSSLEALAKKKGIRYRTVSMGKPSYPRAIMKLMSIMRQHQSDIVHTHGSRDSWIASIAARLSSVRPLIVLTRHKSVPISKTLINHVLYHWLVHSIVTTGGERMRQQLIKHNGFDERRVFSIPTGADVKLFNPWHDGTPFRKELGINKDEYVVGSINFLRGYKGNEFLIEAAGKVLERAPNTRFVIVGDGPERERLRAQIDRLGLNNKVIMTGHRGDIPQVIAGLDLFVVTSTSAETLTQVIPQALAMEKPVVATNVGGIPDVVIHAVTGFLVPPRDVCSLTDHILFMMTNRQHGQKMAREGRRLVVESYSSQATLHRNEELYGHLLQAHGPGLQG